MTKIGLLADTHHFLDPSVFEYFKDCHEIWHAGDFGSMDVLAQLNTTQKTIRGVYGNIDGREIRHTFPEQLVFMCEGVKVLMRHIGGYPPKYNVQTKIALMEHRPQLFICGHSHILKIMYDDRLSCLHMNPGAAGKQGWHKLRTIIRFGIHENEIKDCEVIELGGKSITLPSPQ